MSYKKLTSGQKVYFNNEGIPMELIARNNRYAVVVRNLDIKEDFDLLMFEVERGAYFSSQEAYENCKDEPVYSILDFENEWRAPSDLIFCNYDFFSKEGCIDCLIDLKKGIGGLSRRHGIELNIDWERTLKQ